MVKVAQRRSPQIADLSEGFGEWLTPTDAAFIAERIAQIARRAAEDVVARQAGAYESIVWTFPKVAGPEEGALGAGLAPQLIALPCRPVELMASCGVTQADAMSIALLYSIDQGASWHSATYDNAVIPPGAHVGYSSSFVWTLESDRADTEPPRADGAVPLVFHPGDLVRVEINVGTGTMLNLIVTLRTQRTGEHAPLSRR